MKTYENLRGKRADVRGRQVRANKILFSSPWLALIPFTALLLPASQPLYPFLPREISRVYVSIFICSFIVARKKIRKREKFSSYYQLKFRSPKRTRTKRLLRVDRRIDFVVCLHFNWQTVTRKTH